MKSYTTKRNVEQLSVFVLPEEKQKVLKKAKEENRSVSNFCKKIIMEAIQN